MIPNIARIAKYGNMKVDDLTVSAIVDIADALGHKLDATDATLAGVIDLLKADNIDALSDILSTPNVLMKLKNYLQPVPPVNDYLVRACNHCGRLNSYEVPT